MWQPVAMVVVRTGPHTLVVSSAVDKEKALVDLAPHTRHKSLSTLQGYVRNRDKWKRSPLFGVGF